MESWDNVKRFNIRITGVPDGEEEEQETENLFEKNNGRKFPQSGKGNKTSKKSRKLRVPKKLDPRKHTARHIIKLPKIKDKERILKAAREKETVTYKAIPISFIS